MWNGTRGNVSAAVRMLEFREQAALKILAVLQGLAEVENWGCGDRIHACGKLYNLLPRLVGTPLQKNLVYLVSGVLSGSGTPKSAGR